MTNPVEQAEAIIETVTVDLKGRPVQFLTPDFAQLALIQHQGRIISGDNVGVDKVQRALSLVYRTIRSWVLVDTDLEYIEDLLADREMALEEILTKVMAEFKRLEEGLQAQQKPVVRRGRPRKATS
jgi:hypothetical protein